MNRVHFNEYDEQGRSLRKESIENILLDRTTLLANTCNHIIGKVEILENNAEMDRSNLTLNTSEITNVNNSFALLNEQWKRLANVSNIFKLQTAGLITQEETLRIFKMQESPDEENHVMAIEIILAKFKEAGLTPEYTYDRIG